MQVTFQYAVKVVCGKQDGEILAPGRYWTAVNVHNPTYHNVRFRTKFATAHPGAESGPVSEFSPARLGPDGALEYDCEDIFELAEGGEEFLKGFLVIQSSEELDVVAVYTAAGEDKQVETFHTERVAPRRLEREGLPDLVPVPDENGSYCIRDEGTLLVTVRNQGATDAGPSETRVNFGSHGIAVRNTPGLPAGNDVTLEFPIPRGCFDSDCEFTIVVDAADDVVESNESNNVASDVCIG